MLSVVLLHLRRRLILTTATLSCMNESKGQPTMTNDKTNKSYARLDSLNASQRRIAARSIYIRRARLTREAVAKIVEVR